jgi:hypothetical protein
MLVHRLFYQSSLSSKNFSRYLSGSSSRTICLDCVHAVTIYLFTVIAVVAHDLEPRFCWIFGLPKPEVVTIASTRNPSVRCSIVVDMIETQEVEPIFITTDTFKILSTVSNEGINLKLNS